MDIGRFLIIAGILFFVSGILFTLIVNLGIPRLPGDIFIKKGNFSFYFPWVTTLLISIILTIVVNLFFRK